MATPPKDKIAALLRQLPSDSRKRLRTMIDTVMLRNRVKDAASKATVHHWDEGAAAADGVQNVWIVTAPSYASYGVIMALLENLQLEIADATFHDRHVVIEVVQRKEVNK